MSKDTHKKPILKTAEDKKRYLLGGIYKSNHKNYWKLKRVIDFLVSLGAIIVLSPFLLIVYIAIFIDDPHGSPIYKQIRIGRHMQEFKMYKFRTMVVNADELQKELMKQNEKDGPAFKMKHDPRITRVGRILRKTSLDELPQLFNILKGDMAIVGPRPPLPSEVDQYTEYQQVRLAVTPGLTCYWQIQPNRDDISFEEWMDMDIDYISKRNLKEDIKLIILTIKSMFLGYGS